MKPSRQKVEQCEGEVEQKLVEDNKIQKLQMWKSFWTFGTWDRWRCGGPSNISFKYILWKPILSKGLMGEWVNPSVTALQ